MPMTKPMRFQKSSFIFLETLFSVLILTTIVALLFHINRSKEQKLLQLNAVHNQFKLKSYDQHFTQQQHTLTFIKNDNETLLFNVNKIIYETQKIKLVQYEN